MIVENCADAKTHNTITAFINLVEADMDDGVIDFKLLHEQRYMPFWKHLCITKLTDDGKDLEVVLWGTDLVTHTGLELTGKRLGAQSFRKAYDVLKRKKLDAIEHKQLSYTSGGIALEEKNETVRWYNACVPMTQNDRASCLAIVCFG
jgi:hypothetical protein